MENEIKAVAFDIDGTITPNSNSWLALTRDLGASVEKHADMFFRDFKEGRASYDAARQQFIAFWQATGNATRSKIQSIYDSWPVFDDAYQLIGFLREKDVPIVFITGATRMYAKIVADKFLIPDYYANGELIFDEQDNLSDFTFPLDESERKLEHLTAYCKKKSISLQNVATVGDSGNDVGIFTATQKGIMVGLDRPEILRKVAWKEANGLLEVKDLLKSYLA